uniref:SJCHGC09061 protein n=1 Tax=Schistosoma japonicum TaxID=6182 RepID=Q5DHD9_SCHJA|nr:SJCHGC09061 protein [Schistosoma japonicum]
MLNSSHSMTNDCKNLVRNSSFHETSKTKNKITGKTYVQNLSPNQATLLNNHKQAIEFNRQLSSQFRGLDLAYSNNKQVHSTTHERKSHRINHQTFLGKQLNDRFATKRCHSAEDIIQLDDDAVGNTNLYPTKERCSSLTYDIQQVNNPLKLDNITQQFKVKRRRKSGRSNRIRSSHSNIDQDNLSKTKTSLFNLLNTQYKSRSLNSINATGIAGDLANVDYGNILCLRHAQMEAASNERMYAWERGEIDYTGTDRFIHILNKLCNTLRDIGGDTNLPTGTDIIK